MFFLPLPLTRFLPLRSSPNLFPFFHCFCSLFVDSLPSHVRTLPSYTLSRTDQQQKTTKVSPSSFSVKSHLSSLSLTTLTPSGRFHLPSKKSATPSLLLALIQFLSEESTTQELPHPSSPLTARRAYTRTCTPARPLKHPPVTFNCLYTKQLNRPPSLFRLASLGPTSTPEALRTTSEQQTTFISHTHALSLLFCLLTFFHRPSQQHSLKELAQEPTPFFPVLLIALVSFFTGEPYFFFEVCRNLDNRVTLLSWRRKGLGAMCVYIRVCSNTFICPPSAYDKERTEVNYIAARG